MDGLLGAGDGSGFVGGAELGAFLLGGLLAGVNRGFQALALLFQDVLAAALKLFGALAGFLGQLFGLGPRAGGGLFGAAARFFRRLHRAVAELDAALADLSPRFLAGLRRGH